MTQRLPTLMRLSMDYAQLIAHNGPSQLNFVSVLMYEVPRCVLIFIKHFLNLSCLAAQQHMLNDVFALINRDAKQILADALGGPFFQTVEFEVVARPGIVH